MKVSVLTATAIALALGGVASAQGFPGDLPPQATPGECYARIVHPAEYDTIPETVVTEEGRETIDVSDAEFMPADIAVTTKEAGFRYDVRQPKWESRTETVVVKPGHDKLKVVPARYNTVTETITVGEPRKVWKRGANLSSVKRVDPRTGEVFCLVEEPAKTVTVTRKVLVEAEKVERVPVAPVTQTVTRQVMVDEGKVDKVPTAAETRVLKGQQLVREARSSTRAIAPRTQTVNRYKLRHPERQEWVQVLCETNATVDRVSDIQSALASRGYYKGAVDGILGPMTNSAIERFQRDNGLPANGYLTLDTLRLLGVGGGYQRHSALPAADLDGAARSYAAAAPAASTPVEHAPAEQAPVAAAPAADAPREYSVRRRLSWSGN